jgi:nucleotide-binding universal stress UspA family protein
VRKEIREVYKKIMVPLDGSKLAECVLPHVETIIKGCKSPQVLLVRAVEPITIPYGREAAKVTSIEQLTALETHNKLDAEKYLERIVAHLRKTGANVNADVIYGKAAETLSEFAIKNDVDLVVIATHGRSGISRWVWGSVAERLLHSICVPVLIVRAPGCGLGI